jgi:Cytochrome c7 and related cytochrome c
MSVRVRSLLRWSAAGASIVVLTASWSGFNLPGNHQGYEPVQPIAYSHRLHAGELKIPCLYCHYGAEKSRNAGIPASSVCMNCHSSIWASATAMRAEAERAAAAKEPMRVVASPELRKLYDAMAVDANLDPDPSRPARPIQWLRIHRLPDFVYFDHRSHVNKGVLCQTCHGPIETMQRVRQFSDLSMGWCVDCHRQANRQGIRGQSVHATLDCTGCHF